MSSEEYCDAFGKLFKEHRREAGLTLREFCRQHGFDHGNVSKLERGKLKPPTGETLNKYLAALGVEPDSETWREFHDTAAACAGEVPARIMEDEELVRKLPVVFRTIGRRRPTEDELGRLIDLIRES